MKKVLLITEMFPPMLGGAANYYYKLCANLPAANVVVLADNSYEATRNLTFKSFKFKVYYKSFFFKNKYIWPKWLRLIYEANKIIKLEKPRILWVGEILPGGLVVLLISKIYGLPYFVSTHGSDVLNPLYKPGIKGRWKRLLVRKVLAGASFVTANAEYTRLILSKMGIPRDRSVTIYPCATLKPPVPENTTSRHIEVIKELKAAGFKILLTAVGHMVRRKGIDKVIESLPLVWSEKPKIAYVITGDGAYKDRLEKMAKAKDSFVDNRSRIIFTGPISESELKKVYELTDIYIMIPRIIQGLTEGFGIVYLEANHFGKPAIGSKITGIPEAINALSDDNHDKATGLLVDNPTNRREIAKKILMLVKDEGLAKKLGANGKIWAEKFNWATEAKKLENKLN